MDDLASVVVAVDGNDPHTEGITRLERLPGLGGVGGRHILLGEKLWVKRGVLEVLVHDPRSCGCKTLCLLKVEELIDEIHRRHELLQGVPLHRLFVLGHEDRYCSVNDVSHDIGASLVVANLLQIIIINVVQGALTSQPSGLALDPVLLDCVFETTFLFLDGLECGCRIRNVVGEHIKVRLVLVRKHTLKFWSITLLEQLLQKARMPHHLHIVQPSHHEENRGGPAPAVAAIRHVAVQCYRRISALEAAPVLASQTPSHRHLPLDRLVSHIPSTLVPRRRVNLLWRPEPRSPSQRKVCPRHARTVRKVRQPHVDPLPHAPHVVVVSHLALDLDHQIVGFDVEVPNVVLVHVPQPPCSVHPHGQEYQVPLVRCQVLGSEDDFREGRARNSLYWGVDGYVGPGERDEGQHVGMRRASQPSVGQLERG
mmetsp:Transcript_12053/g.29108  ORF Transcript_12053/g.29108 Transcript_12053/m.29108 type:complete len:425 (-) Transcript_12053:909-2183(-)